MTERTLEFQHRFNLIRTTLSEKYGAKLAFATAAVAWLEAIQYTCKLAMLRRDREPDYTIAEAEDEIQKLLISFHKEMCEATGVSHETAIELSKMFREVQRDITGYQGK